MMLIFATSLFWYKLVFMAELLLAEGLATYTLKKKPKFFLRVVLSLILCETAAFLYPIIEVYQNAIYISVMFFILFVLTLFALKFCYDEPWFNILFCGIIAYTVQHVAYETYNYIVSVTGMTSFGNVYGQSDAEYSLATAAVYIAVYGIIYWAVWAFVEYRIRLHEDMEIDRRSMLGFAGAVVLIDIVLNAAVTYANYDMPPVISTVLFLYNVLACCLAIGVQFSMLGKQLAEKELETVEALWSRDRKLYELSKANIELINIKCHDLKKQLRLLRYSSGEVDKLALKEIESAVNIYDSTVKTGCDALDVVLAEKALQCERCGIRLTVFADGSLLNFMSKTDVFSLFENAIANAVEAVMKSENEDQRVIRLRVEQPAGNLVCIHVENYCPQEPRFVDGMPQTTKENAEWHGFGMRSMELICEKYGGGLSVSVENDMFHLDIILHP